MRLINPPYDFCKKGCTQAALFIETKTWCADGKIEMVENYIGCKNEKVCELWKDEDIARKGGAK